LRRKWSTALAASFLCACVIVIAAGDAVAQRSAFANGSRAPSVTIDYGVIESLGPRRSVPRLLQPRVRALLNRGGAGGFRAAPVARPPITSAPVGNLASRSTGKRIVLKPPGSVKKRSPPRRAKRATKSRKSTARARTRAPAKVARKSPARVTKPSAPTPQPPRRIQRAKTPVIAPIAPKPAPKKPAPKKMASRKAAPKPPRPSATAGVRPPPPPVIRPAPTTRPAPSAAKKQTQTAALSPAPKSSGAGAPVRLVFTAGNAKLTNKTAGQLNAVAKRMKSNSKLRLQLMAYAGGATVSASQSRRLSLSRALAVRSYLIEKGVRSTGIDVRALGNKYEGGPSDRVDIIVNDR